jgi:apolipoprotein N-acyltransferase
VPLPLVDVVHSNFYRLVFGYKVQPKGSRSRVYPKHRLAPFAEFFTIRRIPRPRYPTAPPVRPSCASSN